jgi:hypothetical protein
VELVAQSAHPVNSAPIVYVSSIAPLDKPLAPAPASIPKPTPITAVPVALNALVVRSVQILSASAPPV